MRQRIAPVLLALLLVIFVAGTTSGQARLESGGQAPLVGPSRTPTIPPRTVRTLPNGLQVIVAPTREIPKFTLNLIVCSGQSAVPKEMLGLADMVAAMLREGTKNRTGEQIEKDLARFGADLSISPSVDSIGLVLSGLSEYSDPLVELLAEVAGDPAFPEKELERVRSRRLNELKVQQSQPGYLLTQRFRQAVFGEHPYARFGANEKSVSAMKREDLAAFHSSHFVPNNALLIVVGDVDSDKIMRRIEAAFGGWPKAVLREEVPAAAPAAKGRQVFFVQRPGSVQSFIAVGNVSLKRSDPDWFALSLANTIYGGAFNSRLIMNIRENKGYTYSPGSGVSAYADPGFFITNAAVRNEVTGATLMEIFYELDRMRLVKVPAGEIEAAKNYRNGIFVIQLAAQSGLANQLAAIYQYRLPEDYLETFQKHISRITDHDVMSAARKYFDSADARIVIVGDYPKVKDDVELFGPVDLRDVAGNSLPTN